MTTDDFINTMIEIDALLMQSLWHMQSLEHAKAMLKLKEARAMIAEMKEEEDGMDMLNLVK